MDSKVLAATIERIKSSKHILLALPPFPTVDSSASAIALKEVLEKEGKEVTLATSGILPESLHFLSKDIKIDNQLPSGEVLVLKVNIEQAGLEELTYETTPTETTIYLTPKTGTLNEGNVSISKQSSSFDCIIVLGSSNLEDLGDIYANNADTFFKSPVINIDILGTNEYYGAFNLVDVTAVSISEIVYELLMSYGTNFSPSIATALLSGVISRTHSFQDVRTSPKAFTVSAELMDLGGDHQEVVKHIYKTKPLALLQLWGRALARLKNSELQGIMYSALTLQDLEKTDSETVGINPRNVLNELLENLSGFRSISLLVERQGAVYVYLAIHPQISVKDLIQELNVEGVASPQSNFYQIVEFEIAGTLQEVEKKLDTAFQTLLT